MSILGLDGLALGKGVFKHRDHAMCVDYGVDDVPPDRGHLLGEASYDGYQNEQVSATVIISLIDECGISGQPISQSHSDTLTRVIVVLIGRVRLLLLV